MKSVWTGLGLAIALAPFCGPATAGQSASGWKWDAPPAAEQRPEPLQPPAKPTCDPKNANTPECAAEATTTDDGLENALAPPAQMTTTGNRKAKKAGT